MCIYDEEFKLIQQHKPHEEFKHIQQREGSALSRMLLRLMQGVNSPHLQWCPWDNQIIAT
eukprot:CAMPEP_0175051356 /NCGR_PEP_ID=MMETSP0052_2-20121109/7750_1 /TAXON_ID=51329 ORGANISM="Polytomella parva, Strain SAG 63-3" /NCGR_SAMPLE_ID=MMETSP0052_2 /ASSEMBLY_ACC=CAM_ASM_000194 /LENGTH=59 /DNA_ID=CAMNT_0016315623 /DNA_START=1 /DNA_END=176 /DNA_ORIENTATION=+